MNIQEYVISEKGVGNTLAYHVVSFTKSANNEQWIAGETAYFSDHPAQRYKRKENKKIIIITRFTLYSFSLCIVWVRGRFTEEAEEKIM
jgi:hypothetical protein